MIFVMHMCVCVCARARACVCVCVCVCVYLYMFMCIDIEHTQQGRRHLPEVGVAHGDVEIERPKLGVLGPAREGEQVLGPTRVHESAAVEAQVLGKQGEVAVACRHLRVVPALCVCVCV